MEPDLPASVPDRDDAAVGVAGDVFSRFQTPSTSPAAVAVTELPWMPSTPSSASARVHHGHRKQDIELFMGGSPLVLVCLVATNSKRP